MSTQLLLAVCTRALKKPFWTDDDWEDNDEEAPLRYYSDQLD